MEQPISPVNCRIYSIKSRSFLVKNLIKQLDILEEDVIWEDRPNGGLVLYNVERAFRKPVQEGTTHVMCTPDDMIFSDNALSIMNRMIKAHPSAIIQLWPYSIDKYGVDIPKTGLSTPYILSNALCGNGIIMPVSIIDDCFDWIHKETGNDFDKAREEKVIFKYALSHDIPVITTVPSVVQHIGDDYGTTLPYETKGINRKTRWFENHTDESINWDSKEVIPFPGYDYRRITEPYIPLSDEFLINNYFVQKEAIQ